MIKDKDKSSKNIFYASIMVLILIAIGVGVINSRYEKESGVVSEVSDPLTYEQKKVLKYTYEVPNSLRVLDIVSDKQLVIEEDNKLKLYDLGVNEVCEEIADVSKGWSIGNAKFFHDGLVWVEFNHKDSNKNKIFIKCFEDESATELDSYYCNMMFPISVSSKYIIYSTMDKKDTINMKLYDIEDRSSKVISTYKSTDKGNEILISEPSTDNKEVVWSEKINDKITMYSYDIENDIKRVVSEEGIYNPVIKNDKIFAIQRYTYFDEELGCDYASDFIVEYNKENNTWNRFEEGRINNYIDSSHKTVGKLLDNEGPLFCWLSGFNDKYLYNIEKSEFISVEKERDDLMTDIQLVKNNVIYYTSEDCEEKESNLVYVLIDN